MPREFENKGVQVDEKATDSAWALFEDIQTPVPPAGSKGQNVQKQTDIEKTPAAADDLVDALERLVANANQQKPPGSAATGTRPKERRPAQVEQALNDIRMQHPQIATKIDLDWGAPTCQAYIQKLLSDSYGRDQSVRAGFSPAVARALMNLLSLHP